MATTSKLEIKDKQILTALKDFFRSVLKTDEIEAILLPRRLPMKNMVMPTLVSDPDRLEGVDPLSPAFPMNAAKVVSKLTRKTMGNKVAVLLRPCEIRAFIELIKLNQGAMDEIVLIGMDCLGAYQNRDYFRFVGDDAEASTRQFFEKAIEGKGAAFENVDLAAACKACEKPIPVNADVNIGIYGMDANSHLLVQTQTPKGESLIGKMGLPAAEEPAGRQKFIETLINGRIDFRNDMFAETKAETESLEKLTAYLANCVNCYNCRVACPVCYCKECVFVTDVFNHDPSQYLNWASRKGAIKMPTDTVFYHMTRLAHMSTACVGCGQCSNACPNDIPVMELFRLVAEQTQNGFEYEAGRDLSEKPPLSEFREDEFNEVVGIS
jgi:formate dehydrogenase subunit beta